MKLDLIDRFKTVNGTYKLFFDQFSINYQKNYVWKINNKKNI